MTNTFHATWRNVGWQVDWLAWVSTHSRSLFSFQTGFPGTVKQFFSDVSFITDRLLPYMISRTVLILFEGSERKLHVGERGPLVEPE